MSAISATEYCLERQKAGENGMAEMERGEEVPIIAAATYY